MKISIAMATYNGGSFIREQLESFLQQTRLPDEVVFSDDGSTDSTLSELEDFRRKAPFEVRIYRNERRLGYAHNFGRTIELCSGDLIFLSDQDDVWFPQKLERVSRCFEEDPSLLVLINDCAITYGDLRPTGLTKLGQTRTARLGDDVFVTGCCTCIRKELVGIICPIPGQRCAHDVWIHRVGVTLDRRRVLPEVLQYYRRHGQNASAALSSSTEKLRDVEVAKSLWKADPRQLCAYRLALLESLERRLEERSGLIRETGVLSAFELQQALERISDERAAVKGRLKVLERGLPWRLPHAAALFLSGQYRYFSGWRSLIKDCFRR